MIKKALFFFTITITLTVWVVILLRPKKTGVLSSTAPKPTIADIIRVPNGNKINLKYANQSLDLIYIEIPATASMSLIANFNEKLFGETLVEKNSCDVAVNGGFYKDDGLPLGLFLNKGKQLGRLSNSNVANGFFWQDDNGLRSIDRELPYSLEYIDFIFQSGPYINIYNRKLNLINDEYARRSLVGYDNIQKRMYFISIISTDNKYSGPRLSDVPVIFSLPRVIRSLPLSQLLNLDGGGASFFYGRDDISELTLPAISSIGSILCVKFN